MNRIHLIFALFQYVVFNKFKGFIEELISLYWIRSSDLILLIHNVDKQTKNVEHLNPLPSISLLISILIHFCYCYKTIRCKRLDITKLICFDIISRISIQIYLLCLDIKGRICIQIYYVVFRYNKQHIKTNKLCSFYI